MITTSIRGSGGAAAILLHLLLFPLSSPATAQPTIVPLTLAEATERGLDASHRLGELQARQDASEATVLRAKADALPDIALQGGYTRTNHVEAFAIAQPGGRLEVIYPDVPDNWHTRLDVQWPLYTSGRVGALTEAATREAGAAASDLGAGRSDLRLDIARAYWSLVTGRAAVTVVQAALERVEAQLSDARSRFDAGLVAPNDVSSATAQRALQQALLIEAQNASRAANLTLVRLLGLDAGVTVEPRESLEPLPAPPPAVETLIAEARSTRDDRQALELRIAALAARRTAAASGTRPMVFVSGGLDYARPNPRILPRSAEWNDSWDVSLNASWRFFDGGKVAAETATLDAEERALRQRLAEFDTIVDQDVRQRWLDVDSGRARAEASLEAVQSAGDARRVLQDRYAAGVATSTEVLDAQVVLLDAELARTRALASVRIAEAGLARAVGR